MVVGYRIGSRKEAFVLSVMPYVQMGWNALQRRVRASGIALAPAAVEDADAPFVGWCATQRNTTSTPTHRGHRTIRGARISR
jgi:hypothetical protein